MSALISRIRKGVSQRVTRNVTLAARGSKLGAPVASFSFDDFPRSAWLNGGAILEAAGGRGTYFVAGALEGQTIDGHPHFTRDDLKALHAQGHEIGCHTFDHMRIVFESKEAVEGTLQRNADFVRDTVGDVMMTSFAYPFGHANLVTKFRAGRRFAVSRGIWPGVNAGAVDMGQVKAVALESRSWNATDFDALIADAKRRHGWLVFFGHDVAESPSPYGCTPQQLESVVARIKAAGIEMLPVKNAAARVMFG